MSSDFFQQKKSFIIPALFCFIIFAPTLAFDFAWDDGDHVLNNPLLKTEAFPWYIFTEATHPGNLFRPVFYLTLWLNSFVFGLEPWSFHLVNILLHCSVVLLVQLFVSNLTASRSIGFFTAIIFGLSSAQSEVVAAVSYRTESLAACFVLITLIYAQKCLKLGEANLPDVITLGLFSFMAMLSKENGVTVLALLLLVYFWNKSAFNRKAFITLFASGTISLGFYLLLRAKAVLVSAELSSSTSVFDNVLIGQDFITRILKSLYFQGVYLFNLIIPHPIFNDYSYANVSAVFEGTTSELLFVLMAVAFLIIGIINFKKRNLVGFGIAWYFLAFSVTGNFVNLIGTHFANRLTYLPSIGVYLIIGSMFAQLASQKYLRYACVGYLAFMSLMTLFQSSAWKNNRAMCEFDLGLGTKSARVYHSLATVAFKEGNLKAVEEYELKAIQIHPEFWPAHLFLTKLYLTLEDFDKAEESLGLYGKLRPNTVVELESRGWIKFGREDFEAAERIFSEVSLKGVGSEGSILGLYCVAKSLNREEVALRIAGRLSAKARQDIRFRKCSKLPGGFKTQPSL